MTIPQVLFFCAKRVNHLPLIPFSLFSFISFLSYDFILSRPTCDISSASFEKLASIIGESKNGCEEENNYSNW